MDIAEVQIKKVETEKAITDLLNTFQADTGCSCHGIDIALVDVSTQERPASLPVVSMDVRLPSGVPGYARGGIVV